MPSIPGEVILQRTYLPDYVVLAVGAVQPLRASALDRCVRAPSSQNVELLEARRVVWSARGVARLPGQAGETPRVARDTRGSL